MKFLEAGSTLDPVDILKLADVDINDKEVYKKAFNLFEKYTELFAKL